MSDDRIRDSWQANAAAWTRAVRGDAIESRRLGTEAAIVEALRALAPATLLDVGCGEGWLCRAMSAEGVRCTGVDASMPLLAAARELGGGRFEACDYTALAEGDGLPGPFDAIACNFALLAEDIVPLLRGLRRRLAPGGRLVVQTVHPFSACGEAPYRDGWRSEDFSAFGDDGFVMAMPWYFRTLARWVRDLDEAGLRLAALGEPTAPDGGRPLSLLLVAAARA